MANNSPTRELTRAQRAFAWLSASVPQALAQCPTEQPFFFSVGALVLINSLLASAAMGLLLHEIGASAWVVGVVSAFWGLGAILCLDRFLLAGGNDGSGWRKGLKIMLRLFLSLCLAAVVGENLVHFLFAKEIAYQQQVEKQAAVTQARLAAQAHYPEMEQLQQEKTAKQAEVAAKQEEVRRLRADYIQEAEGTAGSKVKGKGELYEQKQRDYLQAGNEAGKIEGEIKALDDRRGTLQKQLDEEVAGVEAAKRDEKGFLASHRALVAAIRDSPSLGLLYFLVTATLVTFEMLGLISKMLRTPGYYEECVSRIADAQNLLSAAQDDARQAAVQRETAEAEQTQLALHDLRVSYMGIVICSLKNGDLSVLNAPQTKLAEALDAQAYQEMHNQLNQRQAPAFTQTPETGDPALSLATPPSIAVVVQDDSGQEEEAFALTFNQRRENVGTQDFLRALAGLENHRPAPPTGPRRPLFQYRATNTQGETLRSDKTLFAQLGRNSTVYLAPA